MEELSHPSMHGTILNLIDHRGDFSESRRTYVRYNHKQGVLEVLLWTWRNNYNIGIGSFTNLNVPKP